MIKTVVQEIIDFVTSEEYNHLYPNVKQEWFNTFLEKEREQIFNAFCNAYLIGEDTITKYDSIAAAEKYYNKVHLLNVQLSERPAH